MPLSASTILQDESLAPVCSQVPDALCPEPTGQCHTHENGGSDEQWVGVWSRQGSNQCRGTECDDNRGHWEQRRIPPGAAREDQVLRKDLPGAQSCLLSVHAGPLASEFSLVSAIPLGANYLLQT